MDFCFTNHAQLRGAQRNIDLEAVQFTVTYGRKFHRTGAVLFFLGKRNIPETLRRDDQIMKLEGTVLIISNDNGNKNELLITCYRNKKGLRQIKRKAKRRSKRSSSINCLAGSDNFLANNGE